MKYRLGVGALICGYHLGEPLSNSRGRCGGKNRTERRAYRSASTWPPSAAAAHVCDGLCAERWPPTAGIGCAAEYTPTMGTRTVFFVLTARNIRDRYGVLYTKQIGLVARLVDNLRKLARPAGTLRLVRRAYVLTFRANKTSAPALKKALRAAAAAARPRLAYHDVRIAFRAPSRRPS
jgi:hypothetical protein